MAGRRGIYFIVMMVVVGGTRAQVDHVVGGDPGWDSSSDIKSWSSNRIFRVGDNVWFTYSAAAEEGILELKSKEEFDSCDVSNPIRMYTAGVDRVGLDGPPGMRYFVSNKPHHCANGLKLHLEVQPSPTLEAQPQLFLAQGPTPSASLRLSCGLFWALALPCFIALV